MVVLYNKLWKLLIDRKNKQSRATENDRNFSKNNDIT